MPNYKGHLCGGVIVYAIVMILFVATAPSLITAGEWFFFTLAGALFPDVDVKSRGQKYFYYSMLLFFVCLLYQGKFEILSCMSFIAITPMLVRHRGIFHKPWFLVIMPIIVWLCLGYLFPMLKQQLLMNVLFFVAGSLSHVLLDRSLSYGLRSRSR